MTKYDSKTGVELWVSNMPIPGGYQWAVRKINIPIPIEFASGMAIS